jgi:hypothetical protein
MSVSAVARSVVTAATLQGRHVCKRSRTLCRFAADVRSWRTMACVVVCPRGKWISFQPRDTHTTPPAKRQGVLWRGDSGMDFIPATRHTHDPAAKRQAVLWRGDSRNGFHSSRETHMSPRPPKDRASFGAATPEMDFIPAARHTHDPARQKTRRPLVRRLRKWISFQPRDTHDPARQRTGHPLARRLRKRISFQPRDTHDSARPHTAPPRALGGNTKARRRDLKNAH